MAQEAPGSRRYTPIVEAARRVAPSVVSINILRIGRTGPRSLFEDFFGRTAPQSRLRRSYGSGFAIDDAGFLVTNEHVVRGADSIVVTDAMGRVHSARVVGADELTDIAVLRIEADFGSLSPDGQSIIAARANRIISYDAATGRERWSEALPAPWLQQAGYFTPDGDRFIVELGPDREGFEAEAEPSIEIPEGALDAESEARGVVVIFDAATDGHQNVLFGDIHITNFGQFHAHHTAN